MLLLLEMLIKPYYEVTFFPFYNAINKGPIVSEHQCRTRSRPTPLQWWERGFCSGAISEDDAFQQGGGRRDSRSHRCQTRICCVAKHLPDKGNTTMHKGKGIRKCKRKNKEQQKQTEKTEKGNKTIDKTKWWCKCDILSKHDFVQTRADLFSKVWGQHKTASLFITEPEQQSEKFIISANLNWADSLNLRKRKMNKVYEGVNSGPLVTSAI